MMIDIEGHSSSSLPSYLPPYTAAITVEQEELIDTFAHYEQLGMGTSKGLKNLKRKNIEMSTDDSHEVTKCPLANAMKVFPITLFKAFNAGDMPKVADLIHRNTTSNVALRTSALPSDVIGPQHIVNLFAFIYDTHPDAVWVAKKCRLEEEEEGHVMFVRCKIYFAGTRLPCHGQQEHAHLFKKAGSSLLDEMDVSDMSEQEIVSMRTLEQRGKNLSVFGKGTMSMRLQHVPEDATCRIGRVQMDWIITSFREAEV